MDAIKPRQLAPGVYLLELGVGQAYLWEWTDGLTLVDTGTPGSAAAILQAIESIGHRPEEVKEIVLTHFHADHTGSAWKWLSAPVPPSLRTAPTRR
jgi:glyoxylase-like metal-dependent hydrolase (beta-lactamase superfamily II)